MEVQVVIVSCKSCVFTQNAESTVLKSLDLISKGDVGNVSLRVTPLDLRELCHSSVAVMVRKAKIQIVIITHAFLDELSNSVQKNFCQVHLNRVLHSRGVICVLMGIDYEEILRNYSRLLPHFMDWNVLELRANKKLDQNFSSAFQEVVIQSYNGRARHNESRIPHPVLGTPFQFQQTRNVAEGGAPNRTSDKPLLISTRSDDGAETITVKLNATVGPSDELRIQLRKGDDVYSTVVQIPDNLSPNSSHGSIVQIEAPFVVMSNLFPNKEDPVDQMINTFPGYKEYLDDHLSLAIENVFSIGSTLENLTLLQEFLNGRENLLPTVLHFATYYGLQKTVAVLMASDLGLNSLGESNEHGETPLEIAKRRGHDATIGEILREFEGTLLAWEEIKHVTCLSVHSYHASPKVSKELSVTASLDDPVFSDPPESSRTSEFFDAATPDLESPLEQLYVNIEVVQPELPERKAEWGESGYRGTYCFPTTADMNYCVPPPPREATALQELGGTVTGSDDYYIDVMAGRYKPGDTLKHINPNVTRVEYPSISTSDDEEELPVYNRPAPLPPTPQVVVDPILKLTPTSNYDPWKMELKEEITKAISKGLNWDEVAEKVKSVQDAPSLSKKANDERHEKILEEMREEYRQKQILAKRETNGTGILDRVIHGIKKATKKISNAGVNIKGNEDVVGDEKQNLIYLSTERADRRSSSLTSLLEEASGDVGGQQSTKIRKWADIGLKLDENLPQNSNTDDVHPSAQSPVGLANSGDSPSGEIVLRNRVETSSGVGSKRMTMINTVRDFAHSVNLEVVDSREVKDTPPQRPPKKGQIKIEPPICLPYANPTPPQHPSGATELTDAERRMRIPPKPARRRSVTGNATYINYKEA